MYQNYLSKYAYIYILDNPSMCCDLMYILFCLVYTIAWNFIQYIENCWVENLSSLYILKIPYFT